MNLLSDVIHLLLGNKKEENSAPTKYRGYIRDAQGYVNPISLLGVNGQFVKLRIHYPHDNTRKSIPLCRVSKLNEVTMVSEFTSSCDNKATYYTAFFVAFPGNSFITLEYSSKTHFFRLLNINKMGPKRIKRGGLLLRAPKSPTTFNLCGRTAGNGGSMEFRFQFEVSPENTFRGLSIVKATVRLNIPRILANGVKYLNQYKKYYRDNTLVSVDNDDDNYTATFSYTLNRNLVIQWPTGRIYDLENCDVMDEVVSLCSFVDREDDPYDGLLKLKDDISIQKESVTGGDELVISVVVARDHFDQMISQC